MTQIQQYRDRFITAYHQRLKRYSTDFLEVPNSRETTLEQFDEDWPTIHRAWQLAREALSNSKASRVMLLNASLESYNLLEARLTHGELREWLKVGLLASELVGFDAGRWLYHSLLGRQEHVFGSMEAAKLHFAAAEQIDGKPVKLLNSTQRFEGLAESCETVADMLEAIGRIANQPKTTHSDLLWRVGIHEVCSELRDRNRPNDALKLSLLAFKRVSHVGDEVGRSNIISEIGLTARSVGDYRRAELCFKWQCTMAQRLGDRRLEFSAEKELANSLFEAGQEGSSDTHARSALQIADSLGDEMGAAEALFHLSQVCVHSRRFREAETHANQALGLYRRRAIQSGVTSCLMILVICSIYGDDRSRTSELLDELERHVNDRGEEASGFIEWARKVVSGELQPSSLTP